MNAAVRASVVVTGATSPIGCELIETLIAAGSVVHAIGRTKPERSRSCVWHAFDLQRGEEFPHFSARTLFHIASLWLLPERLEQFHRNGVWRVIAFSSTSRLSKANSTSVAEQAVAESLARAEDALVSTCIRLGMTYTIFRPTLIYGAGRDRNVADIARFAKRFGIFPMLGNGAGLRQPVHVDDLVGACVLAVDNPASFHRTYNLSGGETLAYRAMVERIFLALGRQARIVSIPETLFQLTIQCARLTPHYRHLKPQMVMRMCQDLCFDHWAAKHDFGFSPRPFVLDRRALGLP